jgi:hypothetical protein
MMEVRASQRSIGTSVSDAFVAYQHVANEVLKETGGAPRKVFAAVLERLRSSEAISDKDLASLAAFFDDFEKSDGKPTRGTQVAARNRYIRMLADSEASQVACVLAEFYQALLNGVVDAAPQMNELAAAARANRTPVVADAGIGALIGFASWWGCRSCHRHRRGGCRRCLPLG